MWAKLWTSVKNFFSGIFKAGPPAVQAPVIPIKPLPVPEPIKPAPEPVQPVPVEVKPVPTPVPQPSYTVLVLGDKGDQVITLQRRLIELGYAAGSPDGIFGPSVDGAVRSFQGDHGLLVDGQVGPKTQAALASATKNPAPVPTPTPQPIDGNALVKAMIAHALTFEGVHEQGGYNRGPMVDKWNEAIGVPHGSSWCMSFAEAMIKDTADMNKTKSKVYRSAGCADVWAHTPAELKHSKDPKPGDLVIWKHSKGGGGHVGIVIEQVNQNTIKTIEGNTSSASHVESNGDGVYVKNRSLAGSGDMKIVGFVTVFPNA